MAPHPLDHFHYTISDDQIGREPAEPRDHAKLFVYNTYTDEIHFDRFYNLAHYLPSPSLMVMNNSGVIPARALFTKDTGGKVEGLFLFNEGIQEDDTIPIIVMKKIVPGRQLFIDKYRFLIARQHHQYFYLKPLFDIELLPEIMLKYGTTPTPRYLGQLSLSEDNLRERYQTIYAGEKKSVAAPTASLHFTDKVFSSLDSKGIDRAEVTLHVGMGTFAEVNEEQIRTKKLHTEPISISLDNSRKIREAKAENKSIVAVGTTAIRTIESQASAILDTTNLTDIQTSTNLFILPGYEFQLADILITNFHVPKSSLMALVQAFLDHKNAKRNLVSLYQVALENEYKFYSFGDSMLIL